jgi:hypothetical protein
LTASVKFSQFGRPESFHEKAGWCQGTLSLSSFRESHSNGAGATPPCHLRLTFRLLVQPKFRKSPDQSARRTFVGSVRMAWSIAGNAATQPAAAPRKSAAEMSPTIRRIIERGCASTHRFRCSSDPREPHSRCATRGTFQTSRKTRLIAELTVCHRVSSADNCFSPPPSNGRCARASRFLSSPNLRGSSPLPPCGGTRCSENVARGVSPRLLV